MSVRNNTVPGLLIVCWLFLSAAVCTPSLEAAVAVPQITDINNGGTAFGEVNVFASEAGAPFQVDETGVFMNNDILVYSMDGLSANDGGGLSFGISNGENGITSTEDGDNTDIDNEEPVDPVFDTIGNTTGKLENGNAIRFSMWMRQDPSDPVVVQPQVEPVLKVELWKEALSGDGDFTPGVAFPGGGDRIWDTDQNASNQLHVDAGQSQASWVDANNNGAISEGQPVAESLVTDQWRLVETSLVIDDDPLDDGFGWGIGSEFFTVEDVEEVRAAMFVGDFVAGTDLTAGGSFWVDNPMLEVFATEADMLATANPNSAPVEFEGLEGDYNGDGVVNAADYVVWRNSEGNAGEGLPADGNGDEEVNGEDYEFWRARYGNTAEMGGGSSISVPEPAAGLLAGCLSAMLGAWRWGRRG